MDNDDMRQLISKRETNWFRGLAVVMVVLSHYAEWWSWFVPTEGNMETFRFALTKLGVYGVDLFFLFSGYGMVKSLGQDRMHPEFIWKRIKNVYIPYFIVVGIIELLSGGFTSAQDFWLFASGYDYWYMFVLFILYIGFIAVYTIVGGKGPRIIALCVFTYIFSYALYNRGMHDFWYMSNIAFALGVIAGEYDGQIKKIVDKAGIPMIIILGIGMLFVIRSGMAENTNMNGGAQEEQIWLGIGATVIWTLLVLNLAARCRMRDKALAFLGKNSLYIYLAHTYIFMICVNNLEFSFMIRFMISASITIIVSFLFRRLLAALPL